MESSQFRERWEIAAKRQELEDLAHDLGHEVGRKGRRAAGQFLQQFGFSVDKAQDPLVRGFRLALIEYMTAYEAGRRAADSERAAEDVAIHEGWLRVLDELRKRPLGPTELAETLKQHVSQASRTLGQMRDEGLVELITSTSGKARPHRLTIRGERVADKARMTDASSWADVQSEAREDLKQLAVRPVDRLMFRDATMKDVYTSLANAHQAAMGLDYRPKQEAALLRCLSDLLVDLSAGYVRPEAREAVPGPHELLLWFVRLYFADREAFRREQGERSPRFAVAVQTADSPFAEAFSIVNSQRSEGVSLEDALQRKEAPRKQPERFGNPFEKNTVPAMLPISRPPRPAFTPTTPSH